MFQISTDPQQFLLRYKKPYPFCQSFGILNNSRASMVFMVSSAPEKNRINKSINLYDNLKHKIAGIKDIQSLLIIVHFNQILLKTCMKNFTHFTSFFLLKFKVRVVVNGLTIELFLCKIFFSELLGDMCRQSVKVNYEIKC